jgi:hypothetical protein
VERGALGPWSIEKVLPGRAAQLLDLAATEIRTAGPSAGQKCKWIIYLQRWSAKGLADLL